MEQNTISFYGLKPTRALQHEIEHRLEKWMSVSLPLQRGDQHGIRAAA